MTTQQQSLADKLFNVVAQAQNAAELPNARYPGDQNAMPNDAIYLNRVMNIKEICSTIEGLVNHARQEAGSQKSEFVLIGEVLVIAILPNRALVEQTLPFCSTALDILFRTYAPNPPETKQNGCSLFS
jgi:hypothetical protein